MQARPRAARPVTSAPMGSGPGVRLTTCRRPAWRLPSPRLSARANCGSRVGNRPEALPPGLSVGVGAETPIGARAGSDAVAPIGVGGARTVTDAEAAGSVCRLAALPVAVRLTDVTVAAVEGDGELRLELPLRGARVHRAQVARGRAVRLPQPKLKCGVPALAGDVRSWIVASGTLPPVVQADTAHCVPVRARRSAARAAPRRTS